ESLIESISLSGTRLSCWRPVRATDEHEMTKSTTTTLAVRLQVLRGANFDMTTPPTVRCQSSADWLHAGRVQQQRVKSNRVLDRKPEDGALAPKWWGYMGCADRSVWITRSKRGPEQALGLSEPPDGPLTSARSLGARVHPELHDPEVRVGIDGPED